MTVENLSKLQISAVRKMAQSLVPLQNTVVRTTTKMVAYASAKQIEFETKMQEFKDIIAQNEEEMDNINLAITTYTGGVTLQEIVNPEANMEPTASTHVDDLDTEAVVDMQEILTPHIEEIVEEELPVTGTSEQLSSAPNTFEGGDDSIEAAGPAL